MEYRRLAEVAEIKICAKSPGRTSTSERPTRWLGCADLLKNNTIEPDLKELPVTPDEECRIRVGDILIKRISPTFVNYVDEVPEETYAGNNLIIVTPGPTVYPRYVAMLLNEHIQTLSESDSIGAVMKSVSRPALESFGIPWIPYDRQTVLGDLWYQGIELEKMKAHLAERETVKRNLQIKEYLESYGGNQNG